MRNAWIGLVIFALIGWGLFGLQIWMASDSHDRRLFENRVNQIALETSEAKRLAQEAHSDSVIRAERDFRAQHAKEDSLKEVAAQRERMASKATIAELKKNREVAGIQPDEDTKRIEAEFEAQQARDEKEIQTLKAKNLRDSESFQNEIQAIGAKLIAEVETSGAKDLVIADLQQEVTRERKKTKVWKWVSGGLGAVVIWMAIKPD